MAKNDNDYAIVVGVRHYSGLPILSGPETDANNIYEWLLSDTGGGLPKANCHLFLSTENPLSPIQDSIDICFGTILNEFQENHKEGRRLYFYFSGHGLGVEFDDTALVLPPWSNI